jgi:hypothetical protein
LKARVKLAASAYPKVFAIWPRFMEAMNTNFFDH